MIRHLKVLGLALVAVFAMSAMVASAAQAQTSFTFTADSYTAHLDGTQLGANHTFKLSGGRHFSCTSTTGTATLTAASSTISSSPVFSGCKSGVGENPDQLPVTVTMEGCTFVFHVTGTDSDKVAHHYVGDVSIVCPPEKHIWIHVYEEGTKPSEHSNTAKILCTYTVDAQTTAANSITYDVTTGVKASEDDVDITATNVAVTVTKKTGTVTNCGGATQAGTYTGNLTVKGTNGVGTQIGVRISD